MSSDAPVAKAAPETRAKRRRWFLEPWRDDEERLVAEALEAENAGKIKGLSDEDARQFYDQVCSNIRTTDDISFKLLNFVPLVSGGAIALLLSQNMSFSSLPVVTFVALFGAAVTWGLSWWERKNIGICHWLIALGEQMEKHRLDLEAGQFLRRPGPPRLRRWAMSKTRCEMIVYRVAIGAWLALPAIAAIAAAVKN